MLERLGEFQIKKKLGEGGMGAVYLAYQESLDRDVALKVLTERLCRDERFITRFKREARSAASIVHPNVIQIYTIGEDAGVHYFAMEFVRGKDLSQQMAEGRSFTVEETLDVVMQGAEALCCASEAGIVHRDLKPANIMLTERGLVKVTDFGLAKMSTDLDVTEAGTIVGTANYMSPEQGQGKMLDVRSDIYSLGVVFFELLAGRVPFQADVPSSVLYMHVYEPPPPPSRFNPRIPPAVDRMILRMLSKDPDERPRDAEMLLRELRGLRQSLGGPAPVAAEPFAESVTPNPPSALVSEAPSSADPLRDVPTGALKALIADDVDTVRLLYRKVLTKLGFTVVEAANGDEALNVWQKESPALVLLDLTMPGKDGLAVLRQKTESALPGEVIVISARKDADSVKQAALSGVSAYLTKPVNVNELRSRISRIMDLPGARRAIRAAEAASSPQEAAAHPDGTSRQVVVYEPAAHTRSLFRGVLETLGHQVACLETVAELDRLLREDLPDLFVLSVGSRNDGVSSVLPVLAQRRDDTRAIFITPENDAQLEQEIQSLGLGPVLSKPVRVGTFRYAVDKVFSNSGPVERATIESDTFTRIVQRQMANDHAYTIFDFAKELAGVLPSGARESFEKRLEDGTPRDVQIGITNLLRRLRDDGKNDIGMRYVRHAYASGNLEVRNFCVSLLPELLDRREEAEALQKIVTDEDFRIRCRALERLAELKFQEAVPTIIRFLNDDIWKVRKAAAACLESFDLDKVIEPLILFYARAKEPLPDRIRQRLLGGAGMKEISLLEQLVERGGVEVREFVAGFLGDLRSKLSVQQLARLLDDTNPRVEAAAARAAGRVQNEKLRDALIGKLSTANSEVQAAVLDGLRHYRLTTAAFVFLEGLADRRKRISDEAVDLLRQLNDHERAVEKLLEALASQPESRRRYISLLLSFLYPDPTALNRVVRRLSSSDRDERRRGIAEVVNTLGEVYRSLTRRSGDTRVQ